MPQQQYTPEQMAYLQQLYAAQQQQQAGGQAAGGGKEKKSRSLTDIVKGSVKGAPGAVMKAPEYKERFFTKLDGCTGTLFRSTATTYAIMATAAPLALTNPFTALITAAFAGTYAFCATNTAYKLCRDTLWIATYPVLRPKKTLDMVIGRIANPFKLVSSLISAPLTLISTVARYPFRAKRKKRFGDKEEVVGTNKYAAHLGRLIGGVGGLDLIYPNFIFKMKGVGYKAFDYGANLLGAGQKYIGSAAKNLAATPQYAYSLAR